MLAALPLTHYDQPLALQRHSHRDQSRFPACTVSMHDLQMLLNRARGFPDLSRLVRLDIKSAPCVSLFYVNDIDQQGPGGAPVTSHD